MLTALASLLTGTSLPDTGTCCSEAFSKADPSPVGFSARATWASNGVFEMLFRTRSAFSKALFSSSSSSSSFGEGLLSARGEDVSEDPNPTRPHFSLHYLTFPAAAG